MTLPRDVSDEFGHAFAFGRGDDLAPVRVNCVSPGIIDTPIRAGMGEAARVDMLAKIAAGLPVGRVGVGDDIARQIMAFMTIGFATGSIVYIDGGALIA